MQHLTNSKWGICPWSHWSTSHSSPDLHSQWWRYCKLCLTPSGGLQVLYSCLIVYCHQFPVNLCPLFCQAKTCSSCSLFSCKDSYFYQVLCYIAHKGLTQSAAYLSHPCAYSAEFTSSAFQFKRKKNTVLYLWSADHRPKPAKIKWFGSYPRCYMQRLCW